MSKKSEKEKAMDAFDTMFIKAATKELEMYEPEGKLENARTMLKLREEIAKLGVKSNKRMIAPGASISSLLKRGTVKPIIEESDEDNRDDSSESLS